MMKKFYFSISIIILVLFTGPACNQNQTIAQEYKEIKPDSVFNILNSTDSSVIVIDVRTPPEFIGELGHISQSILRPVQEIDNWISEFRNDKNKKIIMVCRSGNRSGRAASYFSQEDFKDVYNMIGGMIEWNRLGLPAPKEKSTIEIK